MNLVPQPTSPPRAEVALKAIQARRDAVLHEYRKATIASFHDLWHNADGIPPAEMLERMGTSAVEAFAEHRATVQYLIARGLAMEPADYTPPLAYTEHQDGTITLNNV